MLPREMIDNLGCAIGQAHERGGAGVIEEEARVPVRAYRLPRLAIGPDDLVFAGRQDGPGRKRP
jgi:hypothetical protein